MIEKGRFTFSIFPDVKTSRCLDKRYLAQTTTNHGPTPYYFRKFNQKDCTSRCGEESEDGVLHYILSCPLLGHLRNSIRARRLHGPATTEQKISSLDQSHAACALSPAIGHNRAGPDKGRLNSASQTNGHMYCEHGSR
ncbi:hypothetical protein AVEN_125196-1 [Araneus ventricosus]|uniref:Uncharacterized protein n=1 Tax=Araneus ventricosus TaxID=182803 RepID=A0A4Y2RBS2_ARAVE|nr:hypothetical protein AVEN_125196-1 [Araneus ventricosus]